MKQAVLNLIDISKLIGYKPAELQRLQERQAKVLATYQKELIQVESREYDGGVRYYFNVPPVKSRKPRPLGYTPVAPLANRTTHDPYYKWRKRVAEACTCKTKTTEPATRDYLGRVTPAREVPHPDAYKTNRAAHACTCKAQKILIEGGFV